MGDSSLYAFLRTSGHPVAAGGSGSARLDGKKTKDKLEESHDLDLVPKELLEAVIRFALARGTLIWSDRIY